MKTIILENKFLKVSVLEKGFTIKQIEYKHEGKLIPYLLEFQNENDYNENDIFLNSFVGPVVGRINAPKVELGTRKVKLNTKGKGGYSHGGNDKWSNLIFDIKNLRSDKTKNTLVGKVTQENKELDCTYDIKIILKIFRNNLSLEYIINSDKETICNPTQHLYWNLNSNNINNSRIKFKPNYIWYLDDVSLPSTKDVFKKSLKRTKIDNLLNFKQEQQKKANKSVENSLELGKSKITISNNEKHTKVIMDSTLKSIVYYSQDYPTSYNFTKYNSKIRAAICLEYQRTPFLNNDSKSKSIIINPDDNYQEKTTYKIIYKWLN